MISANDKNNVEYMLGVSACSEGERRVRTRCAVPSTLGYVNAM